jgi:HEAT repeat protein
MNPRHSATQGVLTWCKTLAMAGVFLAAIWIVFDQVVADLFVSDSLGLALAGAIVSSAAVLLMIVTIGVRKIIEQVRMRSRSRHESVTLEGLAGYMITEDGDVDRLYRADPRVFERCLLRLLPTVAGVERDRLSELAGKFGLLARWQKELRSRSEERRFEAISRLALVSTAQSADQLKLALQDRNAGIRAEAARALIVIREQEVLEHVFRAVVNDVLLVRALLVQDLRPYAVALSRRAIPELLRAEDPGTVITTLDIIVAWKRSLEIDTTALLHHPDQDVRVRAFRTLPYVLSSEARLPEIMKALTTEEPSVRAAAIDALRLLRSSPWLSESQPQILAALDLCLREGEPPVAIAAARALAELGDAGWELLEGEIRSGQRPAIAAEAMERRILGPQMGAAS